MTKEYINVLDYSKEILKATQTGVLLTTQYQNSLNTMTISWGTLGIEWNKPMFTVFVRENRKTKSLLDKNPEFTINIPFGQFDQSILGAAGTKSGHTVDKFDLLKLTPVVSDLISVPGIAQLPLTLECKVIYKQEQVSNAITAENNERFYPQDVDSTYHGSNKDYHTAYYGEIVSAYIIRP